VDQERHAIELKVSSLITASILASERTPTALNGQTFHRHQSCTTDLILMSHPLFLLLLGSCLGSQGFIFDAVQFFGSIPGEGKSSGRGDFAL
jgi:hypothetical protein